MSANFVIRLDVHLHHHTEPGAGHTGIEQSIAALRSLIMTSNAELTTQLNDLKTQLDTANTTLAKSQAEITAAVTANTATVATLTQRIAELEAVIAAGGSDVPPEVISAFAAVKSSADATTASANALDALNPDA